MKDRFMGENIRLHALFRRKLYGWFIIVPISYQKNL
jgi:hypothetical protein